MNTAESLTTIISLSVFMLGSILALIWYIGGRIDRLDERIDRLDERLSGRLDTMDGHIMALREDVAVLKATR